MIKSNGFTFYTTGLISEAFVWVLVGLFFTTDCGNEALCEARPLNIHINKNWFQEKAFYICILLYIDGILTNSHKP